MQEKFSAGGTAVLAKARSNSASLFKLPPTSLIRGTLPMMSPFDLAKMSSSEMLAHALLPRLEEIRARIFAQYRQQQEEQRAQLDVLAGPPGGAPVQIEPERKRPREEEVIVIEDEPEAPAEVNAQVELPDWLEELVTNMDGVAADENGDTVFYVDRINGMRDLRRGRQYRVVWRGWPASKAEWKYEWELDGCQEALYQYLADRAERRQAKRQRRN